MELLYRDSPYCFRSHGLFSFLRILQAAHPQWVDMAGIEARMPGITPRQLARFIDLLEAEGLPLVRYETKTRGKYLLSVEPESIRLAGDPEPEPDLRTSFIQPPQPSIGALDTYRNEAWVAWVVALVHSMQALHGGQLSGSDGALGYLDEAEAAANALPSWTSCVVHVRRAQAMVRESRYREAVYWLRRIDTAVRQGRSHPAAHGRAQLIRVKMRYDQARYDEAEGFLVPPSAADGVHCPHWLNTHALLMGRNLITASDVEAPQILAKTLSSLAEALGYVFLWHGDSSLLDPLCYNFGNNLLRGIQRGLFPPDCANTVMQWLAANMLVCRKLGVGDDSILSDLLLIDVGLDYGYSPTAWPQLLRQGLRLSNDLETLLFRALTHARHTGNRLEIAQCLRRQVRLSPSEAVAKPAYFEAVELFGDLGRKTVITQLEDEWHSRFGRSPPQMPKRRTIKSQKGRGED